MLIMMDLIDMIKQRKQTRMAVRERERDERKLRTESMDILKSMAERVA